MDRPPGQDLAHRGGPVAQRCAVRGDRAPGARPAVDVEPPLIERLLADAGSEPGVLPLLQETLVQLWDRRQGQTLTLADYEALGDEQRSGLAVALARRADSTLRTFTPTQEAIARRILLRLVSFGEGRMDTRRQQSRSKRLAAEEDAADFEYVLQQMIAGRLLATDGDDEDQDARVDLAHEVMITAWPTLGEWIRTGRADEQRRRQLEAAAATWIKHGRGVGGLLDEVELDEAEAWRQTTSARKLGVSDDLVALVAASKAALAELERQRREDHEAFVAESRNQQLLLALSYQFLWFASLVNAPTRSSKPAVSSPGSPRRAHHRAPGSR